MHIARTGSRNTFERYSLSQNANAFGPVSAQIYRLHNLSSAFWDRIQRTPACDRASMCLRVLLNEIWLLTITMRSSQLLVSLPFPVS